jgi:hypothetical protein
MSSQLHTKRMPGSVPATDAVASAQLASAPDRGGFIWRERRSAGAGDSRVRSVVRRVLVGAPQSMNGAAELRLSSARTDESKGL